LILALAFAVLAAEPVAPAAPEGAAEAPAVESVGRIPGVTPGPTPSPETVDRLAREIGLGLRCPVCQGLSVSDSTSSTAVTMQQRIRELVALGYDREQIEAYFVSKYGEWVLLAPPVAGFNQLVWFGPLAAVLVGLGVAALRARAPAEDDTPDTVVEEDVRGPPPTDPRVEALLREVDDA
jgi:cytochrome c-type biogenesis protein CcmH